VTPPCPGLCGASIVGTPVPTATERAAASRQSIVLMTGGLGGARLAPALRDAVRPGHLTIVANVGDDLTYNGLRVCPDLDSNLYGLAGLWDTERGWGRRGDTFAAQEVLGLFGSQWFSLGDYDLGLHLWRSQRLSEGWTLTRVTIQATLAFLCGDVTLLPASDEASETSVETRDGRLLGFQEWYVHEHASLQVRRVRLRGAPAAPAALAAITEADTVVLGPSNPVSSLGAILASPGMRSAVAEAPHRVIISPVVARERIVDPGVERHATARRALLAAQGLRDTPAHIAWLYKDIGGTFILDSRDNHERRAIEKLGFAVVTTNLLNPRQLAATLHALTDPERSGAAEQVRT
jgi:LPPG:FO 2-phospho-L-lactate transferase